MAPPLSLRGPAPLSIEIPLPPSMVVAPISALLPILTIWALVAPRFNSETAELELRSVADMSSTYVT